MQKKSNRNCKSKKLALFSANQLLINSRYSYAHQIDQKKFLVENVIAKLEPKLTKRKYKLKRHKKFTLVTKN